jgi:hypothetical protein
MNGYIISVGFTERSKAMNYKPYKQVIKRKRRPLWYYRPSISELKNRFGISRDDAAEIYKERD